MVRARRAAAADVDIAGEYWALVIGIDRYQSAPALDTAVKDAQGVAGVLVGRYGFRRDRVIALFDAKATRSAIEDALSALQEKAGEDDSVLIYYAGHGQWDGGHKMGWWVPVEGAPGRPGTFITNGTIRDYVSGMKARHVYLVSDSCFSGSLFGKRRSMPPINDRFYALLYKDKSRWGLTSGGTEPVSDQGKDGHSLFAYHFIKLLRENEAPYLVPSQIFNTLAPIIANNAEQKPLSEPLQYAGDEGGQFVFRLASAGPDRVPVPPVPPWPSSSPESENLKAIREKCLNDEALLEKYIKTKLESLRIDIWESRFFSDRKKSFCLESSLGDASELCNGKISCLENMANEAHTINLQWSGSKLPMSRGIQVHSGARVEGISTDIRSVIESASPTLEFCVEIEDIWPGMTTLMFMPRELAKFGELERIIKVTKRDDICQQLRLKNCANDFKPVVRRGDYICESTPQ